MGARHIHWKPTKSKPCARHPETPQPAFPRKDQKRTNATPALLARNAANRRAQPVITPCQCQLPSTPLVCLYKPRPHTPPPLKQSKYYWSATNQSRAHLLVAPRPLLPPSSLRSRRRSPSRKNIPMAPRAAAFLVAALAVFLLLASTASAQDFTAPSSAPAPAPDAGAAAAAPASAALAVVVSLLAASLMH
jgi:hypothetical protein